jgi:hypothetical protein
MSLTDDFRASSEFDVRRPFWRHYVTACAVLAAFLLAVPALSQVNLSTCVIPPNALVIPPASGDFYSNFASPSAIANPPTGVPTAIQISPIAGANEAGDRNATYFPLYYSISNLNAWMNSSITATHLNPYCPVELVIAGIFPDVRYFSITDNDMHYTATQHQADADIDPAIAGASQNPFLPNTPYNGSQPYLAPVSLGWATSGATPGCGITTYQEDNLLDGTQRHASMDWNTNTSPQAPSVAGGQLVPHVIDAPDHQPHSYTNGLTAGPNMAGSVVLRAYLPPYSCSGTEGSTFSCSPSPPIATPYLFVRDVKSGCPYSLSYLTTPNWTPNSTTPLQPLVYDAALITPPPAQTPNCTQNPPPVGCDAIVSTADLSGSAASPAPNWLDQVQQQQHRTNADLTAQACYANGDPNSTPTPTFPNKVPWAREAEWNGTAGVDDSYIGGAISTTDLSGMLNGNACNSTKECVIRFRFQLPAMPDTPCNPGSNCHLTGNEQLRYMSLTFWQQQHCPGSSNVCALAIASLADSAFMAANGYVTLIVNVAPSKNLPSWLALGSGTGVVQGVAPGANAFKYYTAWRTAGGYNVLDLNGFSTGPSAFSTQYSLLVTMRNKLPSSTFNCSGSVVPFSTAEYTSSGGLMGPYVPQVDYVDPNSLPQTPPSLSQLPLPSSSSCGVLPQVLPGFNSPLTQGLLDWPNQSWPGSTTGGSLPLNCTTQSAGSPTINLVATQFPTPVDDSNYGGSPSNCNSPYTNNSCSQIIVQSSQAEAGNPPGPWQAPLPITINGSGFGFLPNIPEVMASCSTPTSCPNYLRIQNDGNSLLHLPWDTSSGAACQVYIANWIDTNISLVAGLPVLIKDGYEQNYQPGAYLSPLSDMNYLSFFQNLASTAPPLVCPVAYNTAAQQGDNLTFTVTNPQSGLTFVLSPAVPVQPAGTQPN